MVILFTEGDMLSFGRHLANEITNYEAIEDQTLLNALDDWYKQEVNKREENED